MAILIYGTENERESNSQKTEEIHDICCELFPLDRRTQRC